MKRIRTEYTFRMGKVKKTLRFAVASDLHSDSFDDVLEEFNCCDAVLIPGDLVDRHRRNNENALRFLQTVPEIVPVPLAVTSATVAFWSSVSVPESVNVRTAVFPSTHVEPPFQAESDQVPEPGCV